MKKWLFLSLSLITLNSFGSQIGIGIFSQKIKVWQYWEREGDSMKPKILIYNVSANKIKIELKREILDRNFLREDTSKRSTILNKTLIAKKKFLILDMPFSQSEYLELISIVVDGKNVGVLDARQMNIPENIPQARYYSNDGLNGSGGVIWMSKNNLFSAKGKLDSISLHYFYDNNGNYDSSGVVNTLFLNNKSLSFEVLKHNMKIGESDLDSSYVVSLPYHRDYDRKKRQRLAANEPVDVIVRFVPISKNTDWDVRVFYLQTNPVKHLWGARFTLPILF